MARERKPQIAVSAEARDRFRDFAHVHGVSMTSLLECFIWKVDPDAAWDELTPGQQAAIQEARALDVERRSREG